MPEFQYGMRSNPAVADRLNPVLRPGYAGGSTHSVVSFFAGCGGLDLGALGGFNFHGKYYEPQAFDIVAAYDRGGSVCLNSPARLLSGAFAGFMPLREAVG